MGRILNLGQGLRSDFFASSPIGEEEERGIELQRQIEQNLVRYRRMRGLSQESLARQAGVSLTALQQAESGEAMPSIGFLWKVAPALEVSCLALTGGQTASREIPRRSDGLAKIPA